MALGNSFWLKPSLHPAPSFCAPRGLLPHNRGHSRALTSGPPQALWALHLHRDWSVRAPRPCTQEVRLSPQQQWTGGQDPLLPAGGWTGQRGSPGDQPPGDRGQLRTGPLAWWQVGVQRSGPGGARLLQKMWTKGRTHMGDLPRRPTDRPQRESTIVWAAWEKRLRVGPLRRGRQHLGPGPFFEEPAWGLSAFSVSPRCVPAPVPGSSKRASPG